MADATTGGGSFQPVAEIISRVDTGFGWADNSAQGLKIIAGSEAFRRYDWLRGTPFMNSVGDLRGMVINGRWRVVFRYVSTGGEVIGRVALFASFAANIADQWGKVEQVMRSTDSSAMKALKLAPIAGTAAQRTLAGTATGLLSLTLLSMQGYCQMYGLLGADAESFSNRCVASLQATDKSVNSFVKTWADSDRQGQAIVNILVGMGALH